MDLRITPNFLALNGKTKGNKPHHKMHSETLAAKSLRINLDKIREIVARRIQIIPKNTINTK
jgi:hypothetical protein